MSEAGKRVTLFPSPSQMLEALVAKSNMSVPVALSELVDNALDAASANVTITYSKTEGVLCIADDGHGMPDPAVLVTPYRRADHDSTMAGRYGIGGTSGLFHLSKGEGEIVIESTHQGIGRKVRLNLGDVKKTDEWKAWKHACLSIPGTRITITRCREIRVDAFRRLESKLAVDYAPSLRRGATITIKTDDETFAVKSFSSPNVIATKLFRVVVDDREVSGFCSLTAPGEPNPIKGWAVEYGHRFVCTVRDPAGEANLDFGRIYGEIKLPRDWPGVNDHKNGFTEDPQALWEAIGDACREIIDRAVAEGGDIELKSAMDDVNAILDEFTDYQPPVKGRRDSNGRDVENDGVEPTGDGSPHERFSKSQPGEKPMSRKGVPQKIRWAFASQLEDPFQVDITSRTARVLLSEDPIYGWREYLPHPRFLAHAIIQIVATDCVIRGRDPYQLMFPDIEAQSVAQAYAAIMRFRRVREESVCAAT